MAMGADERVAGWLAGWLSCEILTITTMYTHTTQTIEPPSIHPSTKVSASSPSTKKDTAGARKMNLPELIFGYSSPF